MGKMNPGARPEISVFIAASLDGYIADENDSIAFLDSMSAPEGEDCGFADFISNIDAIIMGRKTYQVTLQITKGEWPHQGKRVIVLSQTLETVHSQAELYRGGLEELMAKLQKEGVSRCWVDGGSVITAFLKQGLIDNFTLSIIPLILGSGIPLFSAIQKQLPLRLVASRSYPFGLVQIQYQVITPE